MKGVKPFIVFSVLQLVLLGNPCDGQFHWGKNYRLEANTLANLLLGNEDSVDENMKVSFVSNRLTLIGSIQIKKGHIGKNSLLFFIEI